MISDEFKKYFKFPLVYREDYIYVLGNNGEPVLTWLISPGEFSDGEPSEIVNKMNGYSMKKYKYKWAIKDDVFIYYGKKKMFLVRGWHMLVDTKQHNIPYEYALKLRKMFAEHIINNLNK